MIHVTVETVVAQAWPENETRAASRDNLNSNNSNLVVNLFQYQITRASSVKVAELCELIVNLVTCHQHCEPYELPYLVTMACKAITTIVALL